MSFHAKHQRLVVHWGQAEIWGGRSTEVTGFREWERLSGSTCGVEEASGEQLEEHFATCLYLLYGHLACEIPRLV